MTRTVMTTTTMKMATDQTSTAVVAAFLGGAGAQLFLCGGFQCPVEHWAQLVVARSFRRADARLSRSHTRPSQG